MPAEASGAGRGGGTPGRRALAALDRALAGRPGKDDDAFSEATLCLGAFRDALIRRRRGDAQQGGDALEHLNAVLSVVLAGHFPLGAVPWGEIEAARAWLAALTETLEPA
ncbi:hypothetical protein [Methylobacterium sp. A54F]